MSNLTILLFGTAIAAISACTAFAQAVPSPSTMVLSVGLQAASAPAVATQIIRPPVANIDPKDLEDWRAAELADTRESYNAYLAAHPEGWFKNMASSAIEPGVPASVGERPYSNVATPNRQQLAQIREWQESVWQSAKTVGTHMAMRGYLWRVRNGARMQEAVELLNETRPKLPEGIPVDCLFTEASPRIAIRFDIQRFYPDEAIRRGMGGTSSGDILIDRTGAVLAFLNPRYSDTRVFAPSVVLGVFRMQFEPLRAGCLTGPPISPFTITYRLG